jgi:uncharacterized protein YgiM (DUF1202 family)
LFQLHEGTKVTIKSVLGDWAEIKIGNGNVGWVEIKVLKKYKKNRLFLSLKN